MSCQRCDKRTHRINVELIAEQVGAHPLCLGTTKSGAPRHPLYVRSDTPLVPYTEQRAAA
jgi:hypothetical protein